MGGDKPGTADQRDIPHHGQHTRWGEEGEMRDIWNGGVCLPKSLLSRRGLNITLPVGNKEQFLVLLCLCEQLLLCL